MLDTLGRRNRRIPDYRCRECGKTFRPLRASQKYCSRPCMWKNNGGHNRKDASWWVDNKGYWVGRIWVNGKRVFKRKHRWMVEQTIGRQLLRSEVVHHKNGDKRDNRIDNLEVMEFGKHSSMENLTREHKRGYKLHLTQEQRRDRSEMAKNSGLSERARDAIRKAEGK